jgi:DNA-binding Lrp family transcriptional regulator
VRLVEQDTGYGWVRREHVETVDPQPVALNAVSCEICATIVRIDAIDVTILKLLVEDGRRTYGDIGRQVNLSPPAVKRRVDRLRAKGILRGFTAVIDHSALGAATEALVELFYAPGTLLDEVTRRLEKHPEVVEAWSVTGEADAIARVRTQDNADLERLIMELQRDGLVERTRSQIVMSQLLGPPETELPPGPSA